MSHAESSLLKQSMTIFQGRLDLMKKMLFFLFLFSILLPSWLMAAEDFALKDGDRIVFYGDSITQDGTYCQMVEWYTATRFPERNITFFYAGVGGDRVSGGGAGPIEQRLERDVIAHKPTVVTIMLGMNDASYRPFDEAIFKTYCDGYRKIVSCLKDALPGVRLTLIQPSPFDDIARPPQFEGGYDGVLRRYGQFVAELAKEQAATLVDFGTPVNKGLNMVQVHNPALARQLIPDRVHPGPSCHYVMGAALLRAWGAPSLVSQLAIDGSQSKVLGVENSSVSDLVRHDKKLSWKQTDKAFPLPVNFADGDIELAETAGAGLASLDRTILKVTNLPAGEYELRIDDQPILSTNGSAWAKGINLAAYRTPILWQHSYSVRWSTEGRKNIQTIRRDVLVSAEKDSSYLKTAEDLLRLNSSTREDQQKSLQPREHQFELVPVTAPK